MVLDRGSWKAAWALSLLEDPFARPEFGGDEQELSAVAVIAQKADQAAKAAGDGGRPASLSLTQ